MQLGTEVVVDDDVVKVDVVDEVVVVTGALVNWIDRRPVRNFVPPALVQAGPCDGVIAPEIETAPVALSRNMP